MKRSSFQKRITALRNRLRDLPLDTLWIIQPENRRYLSGFKAEDTLFTESSGSLLITEKVALLLTDSRYTLEAEKEAPDFEVITLKKGLVESLPRLLSDLGARNLGFEETYVTWEIHRQILGKLKNLSPRPRLAPLKGLVEGMREVKDREEIRAMESSSDLMSRILGEVIANLEPGPQETLVVPQLERDGRHIRGHRLLRDLRARPVGQAAAGERGAPHSLPRRPAAPGERLPGGRVSARRGNRQLRDRSVGAELRAPARGPLTRTSRSRPTPPKRPSKKP
jgi:Xaa-Pro aminopeptidase